MRRPESREVALIERDADPLFFAPDHMTGHVKPVSREHQREVFGDANRAGDVQRRPGIRHIADHAIDGAAAELDGPGLQYAMTCDVPLLGHEARYRKLLRIR
jgi:hypothetical protein